MSTIPPLIPANGILNPESPVKNSPNPITSVNNGFIHNSIGSVANPVTNQNGQLGANAMVNLAKMASSQPKPTIQTNVVHNSAMPPSSSSGINMAQHTVVCQGSPMKPAGPAQVVISQQPQHVQPRPPFPQHQPNVVRVSQPGQPPNMSQPIIIPRGAVSSYTYNLLSRFR